MRLNGQLITEIDSGLYFLSGLILPSGTLLNVCTYKLMTNEVMLLFTPLNISVNSSTKKGFFKRRFYFALPRIPLYLQLNSTQFILKYVINSTRRVEM